MNVSEGMPLLRALSETVQKQHHRFHVPCHAGHGFFGLLQELQQNLYTYDLTELPTLDVLGNPAGVLRDSQEQVARWFGARDSFYLVNGATVGLMAALLACGVTEQSHVLLARNAHRSVIQGLVLTGATPQWILPDMLTDWGLWGAVSPRRLEAVLASASPRPEIFVLTHPTYEGLPSDVAAIASVCKRYGVKLIVDEAHGSLWPLFPDLLPQSAMAAGADAVVHSLHKSAGCLTQSALLHLPHGSAILPEAAQDALNLLQTTSPSYVLLANMEAVCAFWASASGQALFQRHYQTVAGLRAWIDSSLGSIRLLPSPSGQPFGLQLYLKSRQLPGEAFAEQLEDLHGIAYESVTPYGVLLLMNAGLSQADFEALQNALSAIEAEPVFEPVAEKLVLSASSQFALPEMASTPREAFQCAGRQVARENAVGCVSKQVVANCPPGIPVVVPGECISRAHLPFLPDVLTVIA